MSVAGDRYRRYGGNTTCFHVEVEPGHHLVIDCGSGLRTLQHDVAGRDSQRYTVLFTHYHWDHVQGLPVFMPLFDPTTSMEFCGPHFEGRSVRDVLAGVIRPPWWPISLDDVAADLSFCDGSLSRVGPVSISTVPGTHPQGVLAYRLETAERSIVIATDHEAGNPDAEAALVDLAAGSDVLIHDAQYTPEEARGDRRGWGHSSYESAVRAAQDADVGRLVLTSHDPDRSDEEIDRLRGMARAGFPHTDAAYEGMVIPL